MAGRCLLSEPAAPPPVDSEPEFHTRPPLGLPTGSVRALLTVFVLGVVVHEIVVGRIVAVIWTETLVIALAYYFTYRRFVALSPQVVSRLEQEGLIPRDANPLWLPRHTIRVLIVLTIIGLGAYLYRENRLFESQAVAIFGTTLCYLLGVLIRALSRWRSKPGRSLSSHLWEDLKAAGVLLTVGGTAVLYFMLGADQIPHWLETVTVGLVLFYFGSR